MLSMRVSTVVMAVVRVGFGAVDLAPKRRFMVARWVGRGRAGWRGRWSCDGGGSVVVVVVVDG
jgi:hypothetical protein